MKSGVVGMFYKAIPPTGVFFIRLVMVVLLESACGFLGLFVPCCFYLVSRAWVRKCFFSFFVVR